MRPSPDCVPSIVMHLTSQFGWRHANGIAVIRFFVAVWLICLGCILCAIGDWWGAFLFPAAGMVASLAYLMPRWKRVIDAQRHRRPHDA